MQIVKLRKVGNSTIMAIATGQISKEQLAWWLETVVSGTVPDITTE